MRAAALILGLSVVSVAPAAASIEVRFEGGGSLLAEDVEIRGDLAVLTLPGGGQLAVESRRVRSIIEIPEVPLATELPAEAPAAVETAPGSVAGPVEAEPRAAVRPFAPPPPEGVRHGGYWDLIQESARRHGVDAELLRCVLLVESGFDPAAVSPKGAQGLAQLMPVTASELGVEDPFDPAQSVEGAARLLSSLLQENGGRFVPALAAYNAGRGAVRRYGGLPPYGETIRYIEKVLTLYHSR